MKIRLVIHLLFISLLCAGISAAQTPEVEQRARVYEPWLREAGAREGVDPRLLWTIAYLESRFQPAAVSRAGARGMMQFMPATAARFALADPHEPRAALAAAARYLCVLQAQFGRRLDLILAAYNAGEGAVIAFRDGRTLTLANGKTINPRGLQTNGVPPYRETQEYVQRGVALYQSLVRGAHLSPELPAPRWRTEPMITAEVIAATPPDEVRQQAPQSLYPQAVSPAVTTARSFYARP